jgi:hypothetical protein
MNLSDNHLGGNCGYLSLLYTINNEVFLCGPHAIQPGDEAN